MGEWSNFSSRTLKSRVSVVRCRKCIQESQFSTSNNTTIRGILPYVFSILSLLILILCKQWPCKLQYHYAYVFAIYVCFVWMDCMNEICVRTMSWRLSFVRYLVYELRSNGVSAICELASGKRGKTDWMRKMAKCMWYRNFNAT